MSDEETVRFRMLTFNKCYIWADGWINEHCSLNIVVLRVIGIQHRLRYVGNVFLVYMLSAFCQGLAVIDPNQFLLHSRQHSFLP